MTPRPFAQVLLQSQSADDEASCTGADWLIEKFDAQTDAFAIRKNGFPIPSGACSTTHIQPLMRLKRDIHCQVLCPEDEDYEYFPGVRDYRNADENDLCACQPGGCALWSLGEMTGQQQDIYLRRGLIESDGRFEYYRVQWGARLRDLLIAEWEAKHGGAELVMDHYVGGQLLHIEPLTADRVDQIYAEAMRSDQQ